MTLILHVDTSLTPAQMTGRVLSAAFWATITCASSTMGNRNGSESRILIDELRSFEASATNRPVTSLNVPPDSTETRGY